jgi:hypothetical protein
MPEGLDYALLTRPETSAKPRAYPSLHALAGAIHRARRGAGLQLHNGDLRAREDAEPRRVVSVFALDAEGQAERFIGAAWLAGGDRRALEAALRAAQPEAGLVPAAA